MGHSNYVRKAESACDSGFTLIELMVVVLIIAILLAIAIPTYLGARDSANARAAQSGIHNALIAEETFYAHNQSFTSVQSDQLAAEAHLDWLTAEPASSSNDGVFATVYDNAGAELSTPTDTEAPAVAIQSWSKNGVCYTEVRVNQTAGSTLAGTYYEASSGACTAPGSISGIAVSSGNASQNVGGGWYPAW